MTLRFTTEQVLELMGDCLENGDDGLIATMISQLCPFWDGPTFGLATPEVKVWWTDNDSRFACAVEFYTQANDAQMDLSAIAEHFSTLRFPDGSRLFPVVNVIERVHCYRVFSDV